MVDLAMDNELDDFTDVVADFFLSNFTQDEVGYLTTMISGLERLGYPFYEDDIRYFMEIEDTYDRIELVDTIRNKVRNDTIKWFYDMFGIEWDSTVPNLFLADMVEAIIAILTTDDIYSLLDYLTIDDITSYEKTTRILSNYSDKYEDITVSTMLVSVSDNFPRALVDFIMDEYRDNDLPTPHDTIPKDRILSAIGKNNSIILSSAKIPYKRLPFLTVLKTLKLYGIDIRSIQDTDTVSSELFVAYNLSSDTDIQTVYDFIEQLDLPYQKRQSILSAIKDYYKKYTDDKSTT